MIIRPLQPTDKDQFYALGREFYFDYSPTQTVTGELVEYDAWQEDLSESDILDANLFKPGLITMVAEDDGRLIGFAVGEVKEQKDKRLNKEGYIAELYVSGASRNKGVGSKLVEALKSEFRNQGCTHIGLEAFANNKKAIELYRRLGLIEYVMIMKGKL